MKTRTRIILSIVIIIVGTYGMYLSLLNDRQVKADTISEWKVTLKNEGFNLMEANLLNGGLLDSTDNLVKVATVEQLLTLAREYGYTTIYIDACDKQLYILHEGAIIFTYL